ncbi:MAG: DUF4258 domain-containing protein [Desulfatirhabdiaceae bacterium]
MTNTLSFNNMDSIREHVRQAQYHISEHVMRSLMVRDVSIPEIKATVTDGVVIETHRHSIRGMSYLILGYPREKPVHVIFTDNEQGWPVILFAYRPASPVWKDARNRQIQGYRSMNETLRKCYFCAGELKNILIGNFDYRLEGKLYVIKQVPAILCLQCGEKYVSGETAGKIDRQISAGNYSGTEVVQVLEYQ